MNFSNEENRRRNHSLDVKVSGKDLPLKENINITLSRSKSYYKEKYITLENVYTSICKKFYPLIIKIDNEDKKKICNKHYKEFFFFCFTCEMHFCLKCQSDHTGHSIINFDDIKINENDIIKEENLVNKKISLLFKGKINKKIDQRTYDMLMNLKKEIIKFNHFVIEKYKKNKNNFYTFYNYYYLYKLKDDLKIDRNDLIKKFFGLNSFKMIINNLKIFYEKQKYR